MAAQQDSHVEHEHGPAGDRQRSADMPNFVILVPVTASRARIDAISTVAILDAQRAASPTFGEPLVLLPRCQ